MFFLGHRSSASASFSSSTVTMGGPSSHALVPSPGSAKRAEELLARVLDHYLDQYLTAGQSVFGERLVVDVPLGQVAGPHGISGRLKTNA